MKRKVAISSKPQLDQSIEEACDLLGDLSDIIKGKHVAIKPNDTWASPSDLTPCTQADTLRGTIRYIKRFSPSKITVSGGSGAAQTEDVFRYLGLDKVIEEENVSFFDHNRPPFIPVSLSYGPMRQVQVNPHILEYDTLISLAQLKVHDAAIVTLSMKNIAMSFPAADFYGHPREKYDHPHTIFKDLHSFIVGMCQRFPIHLAIIVAHPAMKIRGPIGGKTFEGDLTIASRDFVAADTVGAAILDRFGVSHIIEAEKIGLGTADLNLIEIAGVSLDRAIAHFSEKEIS
ncbi:MAG: DUF362 domain-containing protein [Fibrobacter sp.]|jgi:uncharacterized protein (DUF362 family)|nr:DUF362 domain-containing protein [Fibrobacter sp.]